jgi:hypothetical protein
MFLIAILPATHTLFSHQTYCQGWRLIALIGAPVQNEISRELAFGQHICWDHNSRRYLFERFQKARLRLQLASEYVNELP